MIVLALFDRDSLFYKDSLPGNNKLGLLRGYLAINFR